MLKSGGGKKYLHNSTMECFHWSDYSIRFIYMLHQNCRWVEYKTTYNTYFRPYGWASIIRLARINRSIITCINSTNTDSHYIKSVRHKHKVSRSYHIWIADMCVINLTWLNSYYSLNGKLNTDFDLSSCWLMRVVRMEPVHEAASEYTGGRRWHVTIWMTRHFLGLHEEVFTT
jgi:hypothetical protein